MLRPRDPAGMYVLLYALIFLCAGCGERVHTAAARPPAEVQAEVRRMYDSYRGEFPGVKGVTPNELVQLRAKKEVVLVDVREAKERAVSMIPGAITRERFETEKSSLGDRPVVAYCTIGYRSGKYVAELNKQGIPALNLEGSILAWVNAGQPVVDLRGAPTKRVHTYGKQWALLPEGYEAVY